MAGVLGRTYGQLPTDLLGVTEEYGVFGSLILNTEIMNMSAPREPQTLGDRLEIEQSPAKLFMLKKFGGMSNIGNGS